MMIVAVKLAERTVMTEAGDILPITNMLDFLGDETDEADEVVALVIEVDDEHWGIVDLGNFTPVQFH